MLQRVGDDVFVEVRQDAVVVDHRHRVAALQYVVQNRSLRRVAVRLDFSLSRDIALVLPRGENNDTQHRDVRHAAAMVVVAVVGPLQRRHVVHVTRADGDRAFVRVDYAVEDVGEEGDAFGKKDESDDQEACLKRWIDESAVAYANAVVPSAGGAHTASALTWGGAQQWCADINRWSRQCRVRFVDPSFPPTNASLWGSHSRQHKTNISVTWVPLNEVVDASWRFVYSEKGAERTITTWSTARGMLDHDSWVCAIDAVHGDASYWCQQWFGDSDRARCTKKLVDASGQSVVAVNLGRDHQKAVVVDLFVPVLAPLGPSGGGLACAWPHSGDVYAVLLQKAFAKLCGGYATAATVSSHSILRALTRRPIVQLFPGGAWDVVGGLIEKLKAVSSRDKTNRRRSNDQTRFIISFGAFDDHHCAFPLVGMSPMPPPSTSQGIKVRDPTGNMHQIVSAKLGCQLDLDEEDGACAIPEDVFLQLKPVVFELLTDHAHTWRRRRIVVQDGRHKEPGTFHVAISCASLQHVVVQCYARRLSGTKGQDHLLASVNRVGDDDSWTRLDLKPEHTDGDSDQMPHVQVHWTSIAGEYVVSLSMPPSIMSREIDASVASAMKVEDVHANLSLLFQILDRDMDGALDTVELVGFLCDREHLSASDASALRAAVDTFVSRYAIGNGHTQGLTKEDLLHVYETAASVAGNEDQGSLSPAELIWRDMTFLLTNEVTSSTPVISRDDVYEMCCVVYSDRDDVVVAALG